MKNILIIDSNNLLYRSWFVNGGQKFTNSKGRDVTTILLFLRALKSYVEKFEPDEIYTTWDKKLVHPSTNFRKDSKTTDYKGTRDHQNFEEIHKNDDEIVNLIKLLGCKNIYPRVMEADDVIAWLVLSSPLKGNNFTIISSDQDLWQLVGKNVQVFNPVRKVIVNDESFESLTTVKKSEFVLFKSIKGDSSDNINGLDGYGPVKAKKLAENWESMSTKLTPEQKLVVESNCKLIDLSYGFTVHDGEIDSYKEQLEALNSQNPNFTAFKKACEDLEIPSIYNKHSDWVSAFSRQAFKQNINSLIERLKLSVTT